MKTYDIFLMDADDTLYDYDMAENFALEKTFADFGIPYDDSIRQVYRGINTELWKRFETGDITKDVLLTTRFSRLFDVIGAKANPSDFNTKYLNALGEGSFLLDGAVEICKYLTDNQKQIYIVTNGTAITQRMRIENSTIKDFIQKFFISEEIGSQKPQKVFFDHVLSNIVYSSKDRIIIIGDSLSSDIAGGNNAGIDTCWFNKNKAVNTTGIRPTYEISELNEIKRFI